ncbi:hypothetical protein PAAG_01654 [Paracoccidioides lutzii Pb01]|uniref:Uncharacterized protein n=1 Tax=Paracoccidioides lutzii (strain ATCC MYA-826 / Pb01) TaxID=502779 RepID=C1GT09_PARBA|nr:hypothetical protein PAAG_01654 [Paracoccidioides lutzii Pb01]EEH39192.2 hypothetical protein PAAG_01654 [Paracoccidioides lutzii Pb01]
MNEWPFGSSDFSTCVSNGHHQRIDDQSNNQGSERDHLALALTQPISQELKLMVDELRQTIASLHGEIGRLTMPVSTQDHPSQAPHDGYELIATALREVRAKGIEVDALKRENDSLRLKVKELENTPLTQIERTSAANNGRLTPASNSVRHTATSDQRGHSTPMNSNGKRPFLQEIYPSQNGNISLPSVECLQPTSKRMNLTSGVTSLFRIGLPRSIITHKIANEAQNSDTDELAESWQTPKRQQLSTDANRGEETILARAIGPQKSPDKRQDQETKQTFNRKPVKPDKQPKQKIVLKPVRGRPRTKSISATVATTKVPLRDEDNNATSASNPSTSADPSHCPAVDDSEIQSKSRPKKPKKKARRASARLSRRLSLAPLDQGNTQLNSGQEPNSLTAKEITAQEQQARDPQENPTQPTPPDSESLSKTIPNSQSDSDNAPLDREDTAANNQGEGSTQETAQSQSFADPIRDKRKSQIAARNSLAKLAMQREEALDAAA